MERIRQLRQEMGLSQAKLAVRADMDPATLNRLEQGKGNPNIRTLERVAEALGVEVADLFPKAGRRSSREPSLFNGVLADERRALDYRTCAEALDRFSSHWQGRLTFDDLDQRSMWEFGIAAEYFILPVTEQIFDVELAELQEKHGDSPPNSASSPYPDSVMWPAVRRFIDLFFTVATAYERKFGEPARDESGVVYLDEVRKVRERLERKAGVA